MLNNGTLASFSYIEPAFGLSDEHPGSGQSIFTGQAAIANILNKLYEQHMRGPIQSFS